MHARVRAVLSEVCGRLLMLLSPLLLWDTYKFGLATASFGVLAPVHLLTKLIATTLSCRADAKPSKKRRSGCTNSSPVDGSISATSWSPKSSEKCAGVHSCRSRALTAPTTKGSPRRHAAKNRSLS